MDQDRLVALLKSFKERCAKEGDDEVRSAEACGRDGYYAKVTAKHIRQIDVEKWLGEPLPEAPNRKAEKYDADELNRLRKQYGTGGSRNEVVERLLATLDHHLRFAAEEFVRRGLAHDADRAELAQKIATLEADVARLKSNGFELALKAQAADRK